MLKVFFALILIATCGSANAQVCRELFRATPHRDALLERAVLSETPFLPSESQVLRAAKSDVLGNPTVGEKTKRWARRWFSIFEITKVRQDKAAVEFRRRELTADLQALGVEPRKDFRSVLNANRPYLTTALALGLNGAVNYLSYRFYGSVDPMVIYVPLFRVFNWKTTPDSVLQEILDPANATTDAELPATRDYVQSRIGFLTPHLRSGADIVFRNGRAYYHAAILALAVASANPTTIQHLLKPLQSPEAAAAAVDQQIKMVDHGLIKLTVDQNVATLVKAKQKRAYFLASGENQKAQLMDSLIVEIEKENESLKLELP